MKLKKQVQSLDSVPQQFRSLYKKIGDLFILQIDPKELKLEEDTGDEEIDLEVEEDGDEEAAGDKGSDKGGNNELAQMRKRLNEFRQNNIQLRKELEAAKAKPTSNVDEETYQAAMAALEQVQNAEERELIQKGRINEVFARRANKIKAEYEAKLKEAQAIVAKRDQQFQRLQADLRKTKVSQAIRDAADRLKLRIASKAAPDLMNRGFSTFELDEDGKILAYEGDGEERQVRVNEENREFGPEDFLKHLIEEAPHLFESAVGGDINRGTGRSGGGRGSGVVEIDGNDPKSFGQNIDAIAKGKVQVRMKG